MLSCCGAAGPWQEDQRPVTPEADLAAWSPRREARLLRNDRGKL